MTALSRPRAVIFDWDNTLVDSWGCIHDALNATLRHMGQPEWSMDEARIRVALSLRESFPVLFGARWTEAREVFYATFRATHLDRLAPLAGAEAMLDDLAGLDLPLAVVSNKTGELLRREAAHLCWTARFGRLVGANDAARDKPAADPVALALAGSGIVPGPAVWFVGDSVVDMECAANAGCTPLLLRPEPPDAVTFNRWPPRRHLVACAGLMALVREQWVPISAI